MKYCVDCDRATDDVVLQCPACGATAFLHDPRRPSAQRAGARWTYRFSVAGTILAMLLAPAAAPIVVFALAGLPSFGLLAAMVGAPLLYGAELCIGVPGLLWIWLRKDFRLRCFLWLGALAALPVFLMFAAASFDWILGDRPGLVPGRILEKFGSMFLIGILFLTFGLAWGALFRLMAIRRRRESSA